MHYRSLNAALEQYSGNLTQSPVSPTASSCISTVKRKVV